MKHNKKAGEGWNNRRLERFNIKEFNIKKRTNV